MQQEPCWWWTPRGAGLLRLLLQPGGEVGREQSVRKDWALGGSAGRLLRSHTCHTTNRHPPTDTHHPPPTSSCPVSAVAMAAASRSIRPVVGVTAKQQSNCMWWGVTGRPSAPTVLASTQGRRNQHPPNRHAPHISLIAPSYGDSRKSHCNLRLWCVMWPCCMRLRTRAPPLPMPHRAWAPAGGWK